MSNSLEFTGERFTPECEREIWYEHIHRYALARRWCKGLTVLDAACGEGYGTAILAGTAATAQGVDISKKAIEHAQVRYQSIDGLQFQVADCSALPFDDNEFDRVVSFETLEHLEQQDQMLAEFRRVLKPDGFLVISSPDKAIYSDQHGFDNEFHVKELYKDELEALIGRHFSAHKLLGQKLMFHSAIWSMESVDQVSLDQVSDDAIVSPGAITQPAMYFLALCAAEESYLPQCDGQLWLFDDREESVYSHYHSEVRRHIAAGEKIARLEKEIIGLEARVSTQEKTNEVKPNTWWQRLLGKS